MRVALGIIVAVALTAIFISCRDSVPSPRERVLEFVRFIHSDSLPDILPYIDIDSVAVYEFPTAKFEGMSLQEKKNRLIQGFMREGEYRRVWRKSQIVVNEESFMDDTTASVEVSFIDRATRIQYYNQMGLKKRGNSWVICNFKLL